MDTGGMPATHPAIQLTAPAVLGASNATPQTLTSAPAVRQTQVHTVIMPTTPPTSFEVIEYKVSAQPVAFHHPLHWFLADLLENVEFLDSKELQTIGYESFRHMMVQFVGNEHDSEEKRMFMLQEIFDYPLRGKLFHNAPLFWS